MKKKCIIIFSCILAIVLCVTGILLSLYTPQKISFEIYVNYLFLRSNRVEIAYCEWAYPPVKFELTGKDLKDFLACLDFNRLEKRRPCRYSSNPFITFYSNKKELARFAVQQNNYIHCKDFSAWDIYFTHNAQKAFADFLSKHKIRKPIR